MIQLNANHLVYLLEAARWTLLLSLMMRGLFWAAGQALFTRRRKLGTPL